MKIHYQCEQCGVAVADLDVPYDEVKLGFDCLTSEEREDIINMDNESKMLYVKTLCDDCAVGLEETRGENMMFVYTGKATIH